LRKPSSGNTRANSGLYLPLSRVERVSRAHTHARRQADAREQRRQHRVMEQCKDPRSYETNPRNPRIFTSTDCGQTTKTLSSFSLNYLQTLTTLERRKNVLKTLKLFPAGIDFCFESSEGFRNKLFPIGTVFDERTLWANAQNKRSRLVPFPTAHSHSDAKAARHGSFLGTPYTRGPRERAPLAVSAGFAVGKVAAQLKLGTKLR
jgi:hypothetical protein